MSPCGYHFAVLYVKIFAGAEEGLNIVHGCHSCQEWPVWDTCWGRSSWAL